MKSRQELKQQAKAAMNGSYWLNIGVLVVFCLISGALAPTGIGIIVMLPLEVGITLYFVLVARGEKPPFQTMFQSAFSKTFGRKLGGMLWMALFTWLWSLLFFIPGIVKAFSYALTPYILAVCPNVKAQDALKLSMRIMKGKKADLFIMYLSFLGWDLLSVLTFGILQIFYVEPYRQTALAAWYDDAVRVALETGTVTNEELNPVA